MRTTRFISRVTCGWIDGWRWTFWLSYSLSTFVFIERRVVFFPYPELNSCCVLGVWLCLTSRQRESRPSAAGYIVNTQTLSLLKRCCLYGQVPKRVGSLNCGEVLIYGRRTRDRLRASLFLLASPWSSKSAVMYSQSSTIKHTLFRSLSQPFYSFLWEWWSA